MEYARWRRVVFGLRLLSRVCTSVVVVRLLAGGRPVATPFSYFAKKRKQKKATQKCTTGVTGVTGVRVTGVRSCVDAFHALTQLVKA
jgi:hypothetical protein